MSTLKKLAYALSASLCLLVAVNSSNAAGSGIETTYTIEGRIETIDLNRGILVLDDKTFPLAKDVIVKTATGKKGRLGQLYRGKHIRIYFDSGRTGGQAGTIRGIDLLR